MITQVKTKIKEYKKLYGMVKNIQQFRNFTKKFKDDQLPSCIATLEQAFKDGKIDHENYTMYKELYINEMARRRRLAEKKIKK